jgi:two-component system, NarL family, sensor histidine kinase DesK
VSGADENGAKLLDVTDELAGDRPGTVTSTVPGRVETSGDWLSALPSENPRRNRWGTGKRRLVFPAVFLVFLLQTVGGVADNAHGVWAVVGYAIVVLFSIAYLTSVKAVWGDDKHRFWLLYGTLVGLTVAELVIAHQSAFVMCIYIAIIGIARGARWGLVAAVALTAAASFLPPAIGSWHADFDVSIAASLVLTSLAMWAFFGIIRSNHALDEARAQVATLAAEGERNRIARDLHDLLGHSLTTITVKAGLAKRLADHDPARAAVEIGEVEELARRALTDVRAAVSNYRNVTLTTELATAQEVLRATGIHARVLSPTDVVDTDLQELFGWVVREGITNVVRHSQGTTCTVTLGARSIEITDDGPGRLIAGSGNGISGLRERVGAVGGSVDAGPVRGGGWRLAVVVP